MAYGAARYSFSVADPAAGRNDTPRTGQAASALRSTETTYSGLHLLSRLVQSAWEARQRRRAYASIATLPDHMLRDIGLSRIDVVRELRMPF
jgi:uncharacterized protein YjiS (DUF1127 family)